VKFIDEAIITVQSGNGGRGCVSFRREKFIPRGGPDGGDGGDGGDIIFRASSHKRTLYKFRHQKHSKAENGAGGQGQQKTGRAGKSLTIEVPVGTIISDADTGETLFDFVSHGETYVPVKGGRGGRGNKRFASSTHRTPRFAQPGEEGQTLKLSLELKLLADVGIIGLPNAGKSTLISVISSATPKIADYPFTTLTPNLGVVKNAFGEPFVVADIPGLVEGAHEGTGLGIQFLKHIERTRILVHMIDSSAIDQQDPLNAYRTVNRELDFFSQSLSEKVQIPVLNKMDVTEADKMAASFKEALGGDEVMEISAVTGMGIKQLIATLSKRLEELNEEQSSV
jgi:GTPase